MIARTLHLTAIAVLVLAPLASVIGWLAVFSMTIGFVGARLWTDIENIAAWLDGLEAEGL